MARQRNIGPRQPVQRLDVKFSQLIDPHAPDEDHHLDHVQRVLSVKASGFPAYRAEALPI